MRLWLNIPVTAWAGAALLSAGVAGLAMTLKLTMGLNGENIAILALLQMMAVLALAIFSGNSGIISFGHSAFMGLGAYVAGLLTMAAPVQKSALPALPSWLAGHEAGLVPALAAAAVVGLLAGILTGLPLSRLSTGSAAIGTLAFLIIIHVCLVGARDITRGSQTFYGVPRLTSFAVAVAATVVMIFLARLYRETRPGLALRASRENEIAAAAIGIDVRRVRFVGWIVSITLASVAGALYGHYLGAFSPKDFYFDLVFTLIAMLIVGGLYSTSGAVLGVLLLAGVIQVLRRAETGVDLGLFSLPQVFGLPQLGLGLALLFAIWARPAGLAGLGEVRLSLLTRRPDEPAPRPAAASLRPAAPGQILSVRNITVRFGGLTALDDISFDVPMGQVTGLIGPNGAGKTTLINVICGQQRPSGGQVVLGERTLTDLRAHQVAAAGLARTFQNIRLFDRLSALENVAVAAEATGLTRARAESVAMAELHRMGLSDRWNQTAATFAYGDRRRLEIARAMAISPQFLLLDEPAAGMNPSETDRLIETLEALRAERDLGILVVEHDMRLIMRLSDRMVVLNKGQKIAEGTPDQVRTDPAVIEAYIGTKRTKKQPTEEINP